MHLLPVRRPKHGELFPRAKKQRLLKGCCWSDKQQWQPGHEGSLPGTQQEDARQFCVGLFRRKRGRQRPRRLSALQNEDETVWRDLLLDEAQELSLRSGDNVTIARNKPQRRQTTLDGSVTIGPMFTADVVKWILLKFQASTTALSNVLLLVEVFCFSPSF